MENASDALMMAFGVLIFVIALTVAINSLSQAREVSDIVLYSADETNFYEYYDEVETGSSDKREVGLETIIPTLYKYYNEKYTVLFRKGTGYNNGTFATVEPLVLYLTPKKIGKYERKWGNEGDNKLYWENLRTKYQRIFKGSEYFTTTNPTDDKLYGIFSFDLQEEEQRHEPWSGSNEETKKFLDCFIAGTPYEMPATSTDGGVYLKTKSFLSEFSDKKFVEEIVEMKYTAAIDPNEANDEIVVDTSRTNKGKKRIYIFTLISN